MKKLLIALGVVLGLGTLAYTQTTPIYNFIGTEQVRVVLGSGSDVFATMDQFRNTRGISLVATGTTVASAPTNAVGHLVASGAITTWNVTLPNPANYGQKFCVSNGTGSTFSSNTTVAASSGTQTQTLAETFSGQSLNAGASACWVYNQPTSVWYRVQ